MSWPKKTWYESSMRRQNKSLRTFVFDCLLHLEAVLCLTLARLVVAFVSFRRIAPYLGQYMRESPEETGEWNRRRALRVAWGIRRVYPRLPWKCTCLVQAFAAMAMLRRRGQESTLYLGVGRDDEDRIGAHAWLRSGDVVVTGAQEQQAYKAISSFMKTVG